MRLGTSSNPKNHGFSGGISAEMHTDAPNLSGSHGNVRSSIEGEPHDMPGQHAFQLLSSDYGEGRHTAYDSPLAQPAYNEHGKVGQF